MLFCFGLFALLLYYTVVANAECSYTYRNSSQQPIQAQSSNYERQGFQRCEFLIQLVNQQQTLKLNFTQLTGFGLHTPFTHHGQQEGPGQEEEKEEERGDGGGGPGQTGSGGEDGGRGMGREEGRFQTDDDRTFSQPQRPRLFTPTTTVTTVHRDWTSKPSSLSPTVQQQGDTATKQVYANTKLFPKTVASSSPSLTPPPSSGSVEEQGGAPCLPMVEIRTVSRGGQEEFRYRICRQHHPTQTPFVFHYASSVRIVYEWEQKQSSGFTLYFDFSSGENEKCVHTCDGSRCLTDSGQLCDGHHDCHDRSDERTPACLLTSSSSSSSSSSSPSDPLDAESLVQLIVIPSCVVLAVVVVAVLCLLGRRHWQGTHTTMHRGNGHGGHLSCPQSHSSEGLTPSACSTQECNEQVVALLPSSHRCQKSWRPSHTSSHIPPPPPQPTPEPQIGLPPNIPVSPDGEEGYVASQLGLLHPRYHTAHSELFKPPPNKTVFDRESPPPYSVSSSSSGTYGCGSAPSASGAGWLGTGGGRGSGQVRVVRDSEGQAVVSRCYTMFTPSELHHHHQSPHRNDPHRRCPGNNGFTRHYQQRQSPRVHGASRVKDTLHPSTPSSSAAVVVDSSKSFSVAGKGLPSSCSSPVHLASSSGEVSASSSLAPQTVGPSQVLCGSGAGQEYSEASGDHSQGNNSVELGAPPSYQLAFSSGRGGSVVGGGGVEDSPRCATHTSVPTTTTAATAATTTTTTTTTTTSNPAGV